MKDKTKEEICEELNELLDTDIDFTKLSKAEMIELHDALTNFDRIFELLKNNFSFDDFDKAVGAKLMKKIRTKIIEKGLVPGLDEFL